MGTRDILRLPGALGWNLECGPISNEEEDGKHIYFAILGAFSPIGPP